jgi:hypothetical protein
LVALRRGSDGVVVRGCVEKRSQSSLAFDSTFEKDDFLRDQCCWRNMVRSGPQERKVPIVPHLYRLSVRRILYATTYFSIHSRLSDLHAANEPHLPSPTWPHPQRSHPFRGPPRLDRASAWPHLLRFDHFRDSGDMLISAAAQAQRRCGARDTPLRSRLQTVVRPAYGVWLPFTEPTSLDIKRALRPARALSA